MKPRVVCGLALVAALPWLAAGCESVPTEAPPGSGLRALPGLSRPTAALLASEADWELFWREMLGGVPAERRPPPPVALAAEPVVYVAGGVTNVCSSRVPEIKQIQVDADVVRVRIRGVGLGPSNCPYEGPRFPAAASRLTAEQLGDRAVVFVWDAPSVGEQGQWSEAQEVDPAPAEERAPLLRDSVAAGERALVLAWVGGSACAYPASMEALRSFAAFELRPAQFLYRGPCRAVYAPAPMTATLPPLGPGTYRIRVVGPGSAVEVGLRVY